MRHYYIYILSGRSRRLYVGMTNDLLRRLVQHRESNAGFTAKYRIGRLVYFEIAGQVAVVIAREKQIKAFRRAKKIALITSMNPAWNDLSEEFK